jgi:hypothetical protein
LNVHRVSDVRQIGKHTAELLILDPSPFETEIATAKLERYKSPSIDQILAELIQAGETLCSNICHILVNITLFPAGGVCCLGGHDSARVPSSHLVHSYHELVQISIYSDCDIHNRTQELMRLVWMMWRGVKSGP